MATEDDQVPQSEVAGDNNDEGFPPGFSPSIKCDISVTDPEKKGDGMYQYISYKVNTTAELQPGKFTQSAVVRRFSDFVWLHEQLLANCKGVLIPPLPEKAIIGRFSGDFINERRRGLEVFLHRVTTHRVLKDDDTVQLFLLGDDMSMAAAREEKKEAVAVVLATVALCLCSKNQCRQFLILLERVKRGRRVMTTSHAMLSSITLTL